MLKCGAVGEVCAIRKAPDWGCVVLLLSSVHEFSNINELKTARTINGNFFIMVLKFKMLNAFNAKIMQLKDL